MQAIKLNVGGNSRRALERLEGEMAGVIDRAARAATRWCKTRGLPPDPMLLEAMTFTFAALARCIQDGTLGVDPQIDRLIGNLSAAERKRLTPACSQIRRFVRSFKTPSDLVAAIDS